MRPILYIRDRIPIIAIGILCASGVALAVVALGVGRDAASIMAGFVIACLAIGLVGDYARRARFYRDLAFFVKELDQPYYASSLLEEPDFLEGRLDYEAIAAMSKVAADESSRHRQLVSSYRDYIELWIHEVKTPIAAAHLIASGLHGLEASRLKGELDRIESYVEQALFYARSTSLTKDYSIRQIALISCVRDACKKNSRYLIERGTTPSIEIDDGKTVFADQKWLSFVIGQIVVNAAKYGAKSIRFTTWDEGGSTSGGRTTLEIADDGCGISEADVPRVFDKGFTGSNSHSQSSSTGMGLFLVAELCARMGLGLGLASEEGVGTRVLIAFPHDRRSFDLEV